MSVVTRHSTFSQHGSLVLHYSAYDHDDGSSIFPPEMLITTYKSTRCHDPGDSINIDSCFINSCQCLCVHCQDGSAVKPRAVKFANEISDPQCIVADEIIR